MCGIAGFSLNSAEKIDATDLACHLLVCIQQRGYDATGSAWSEGPKVMFSKAPLAASDYVLDDFDMPSDTKTAILHTRWATQGSPKNNDNNHPIVLPGIVGVHNGHVSNDDELIRRAGIGRVGEVDSEAIFAAIKSMGRHKALSSIRGGAAVAWLSPDDPTTLHLARCTRSPLAFGQTRKGSLVFASTMPLLMQACRNASVRLVERFEMPEQTYVSVFDGRIETVERIGASKPSVLVR